jgi:hypothetical protein
MVYTITGDEPMSQPAAQNVSGSSQGGSMPGASSEGLTPQLAIRLAWAVWLLFLVTPFFLFLFSVWTLSNARAHPSASQAEIDHWFLGAMVYLLICVPFSFFARGRVFKAYWSGQPVSPRNYLSGMFTIWLALELGGFLSLAGCLVTGALLPNLLPALLAFMFFTTFWPSGRAMMRHSGHHEDPEVYEEPR